MTDLMNEMIKEVSIRIAENGYAFSHRDTSIGKVTLSAQIINTQSKNNEFRKNWLLDGKRVSAAKLAAM